MMAANMMRVSTCMAPDYDSLIRWPAQGNIIQLPVCTVQCNVDQARACRNILRDLLS